MPDSTDPQPDAKSASTAPVNEAAEATFVGHARTVAGLTVVSRLAGVARDAVCSRAFGAGPLWSAFAFAFLIPNLFRRLFGEGALSAAFLPEYTRLTDRDPEAAGRFARLVIGSVTIFLGVITIIGEVVLWIALANLPDAANANAIGPTGRSSLPAGAAVSSLAESRELVITLMMIMLPYMPLVCLVALLGAMLQVHRRFGPTAASPILLNLCIIAAALVALVGSASADRLQSAIMLVAIAVIIAGVIQVAWSILAMRAVGATMHVARTRVDDESRTRARRMLRMLVPMIIGLGVLQLNTLMDGVIASYPVWAGPTIAGLDYPLDMKSNSILFFTQRLYQFPLGVFGIAIATAIFPSLARTAARSRESFSETLRHGIRLTLFIGIPASVGLMLIRHPLATVILRGNEFVAADVDRVANVLLGYSPAIWAYSLNQVLTRAFYAHDNAKTPVRIALVTVFLNVALNLILIWSLGEAGLAWSTSICATLQSLLLIVAIHRYADQPLSPPVRRSIIQTAILSIVMIPIVLASLYVASRLLGTESWAANLIQLLAATAVGGITCYVVARAFKMIEVAWLVQRSAE